MKLNLKEEFLKSFMLDLFIDGLNLIKLGMIDVYSIAAKPDS